MISLSMNRHSKQPESYHKSSRNSDHHKSSISKFKDSATKSKEKEAKHLKSAKRQCGDWTEHVSSKTGTTYYFNVQTSQSQWEKPLGWRDSHAKDVKPRKTPQKTSYQPTTNHYNNHSSTGNRQNHHHHNSTPAKRHYDVTHDSDFRSPHTGHQKKDGDFRARACSDYDMRRSSLPGNDKDFRHEVLSLNSNHHKTTDATQKGSNGCQLLVGGLRSNSASSAPTDSQTGKVFDYSQHPHAAQGVFRGVGKATPMKPFNHMMSSSPYNSRSDHLGSANHKINMMSSDSSKRANNLHDNHHQASPLLHLMRNNSVHGNSTSQTPNNGPTPNSSSGHGTPTSVTLAISKLLQSVNKPRKRSRHDESPAHQLESSSSKKTRTLSSHTEDLNNHVAPTEDHHPHSNHHGNHTNPVARRLSMHQSPQQPPNSHLQHPHMAYQQNCNQIQYQMQIDASDIFKSMNKLRHVVDGRLMHHAVNWPTNTLEKEVMKKSRDLQSAEMEMWSLNTDLAKQRMSMWQTEAKKLLLQDQLKFLREERKMLTSSFSSHHDPNAMKINKNNMMTSLQPLNDVATVKSRLLGNADSTKAGTQIK